MATSSLARDFRKINIEQYDEDFYVEDDYSQGAGAPDEGAIQMAISGGKPLVCSKKPSYSERHSETLHFLDNRRPFLSGI